MLRFSFLAQWLLLDFRCVCGTSELPLGVLGHFTPDSAALMLAVIAADLDYRKNWDASLVSRFGSRIVDMPVEVHPNASAITLRGGTTAGKQDVGVATALDMMWGLDGEQPVVGLIGATYSSVTMPIATVAAVQTVPQISFSATSPALSNKDAYPFFLRTAPPDSIQARAFWSWILHFDVALVSCVYTVEGYGQGLYDTLKDLARRSGQQERVQGQALRYMPQEFDKEEARDAATSARQIGSRFLMLFLTWDMVDDFLSVLDEEGMLSPEWHIIRSDTCADLMIVRRGPTGFMVFRASGKGALFPEFERLWSVLEAADGIEVELRQRYKLDNMREPLANGAIEDINRGLLGLNAYFGFAFDAFYAFAIAINQLLHAGIAISAVQGRLLLDELRRVRFTGVSGEVTFDENGDRLVAYELLNMQADGEAVVAAFFNPSSSDFSFQRDLVWMDGSRRSNPPPHLYSCDPGFYKDELSGQCRLCQRGKMCLGGPVAQAVSCPRGSFANGTGTTNCSLCSGGSFASDIGSVECTPCLPGFEAPVPGMQACSRCAAGSYMPFVEGIQCLPCGKNQITRESGATSETECLCPEGSFMCGEAGCLPCPEGLHCPEGLALPQQQSGFWAMELSNGSDSCQFSVLRCRDRFECPQGAVGECAFGREGPACNNCKERHFPEGGTCQPCNGSDIMPGILVLMLVLVILYLLSISTVDPSRVRLSALTAASITSQLIMAIQALTSIQELSIQWKEPVKTLLNLAKVMTFDLHVIRITCLYGSDSPTLHFVSQMLACPLACILLLLSWLLSRLLGRPKPVNSLVHNCGVLIFAFFLSITRSTLIPFQCISSPNGSTSMVTHPGIMCYESTEHVALVALAVGGILTQPAAFLGWATFTTLTYPSHVGSGKGLRFTNRYRFLFQRFKPEKYYYGLVLLYRSAIVALLPIVLAGLPELQVPLMGAVLLVVNNVQAYTCPWRTASANLVDLILTTFLILVLLGAAPLLLLDMEESTAVLGWLLCMPVVGILVVAVVGLARAAINDFRRRQQLFGVFLCHHKGGSGSLCRLMKILIAQQTSARVFLHCDYLENLDFLFDIVRTSTRSVVVVLTPELLKRVWCAGEITTAWKNGITTVPVICDGFRPLSEKEVEVIPTLWTPQQRQTLVNFGVVIDDMHLAYAWLQHELTPVDMPRFGPVSGREAAVLEILRVCGLKPWRMHSIDGLVSSPCSPARARILITSSVADAESLSACEVFKELLQAHMQIECAVVHDALQMTSYRPWAYYLVVLLFRGLFRDQGFAQTLLPACAPGGRNLELVTVIADSHFDFPRIDSLEPEIQSHSVASGAYGLRDPGKLLLDIFQELLNVLALPFSPLGSEGLQQQQVVEIAKRLKRYKDPAAATAQDEEGDFLVQSMGTLDAADVDSTSSGNAAQVRSSAADADEVVYCKVTF